MLVDQTFTNTPGNDAFSGGGGTDAVVFAGSRAHYTLTRTASGWSIGSISDGVDTIQAIERLRFSDRKLALDLSPTERADLIAFLTALTDERSIDQVP